MNPVDRAIELLAPFPVWPAVAASIALIGVVLGTVIVVSLRRDLRHAQKSIRNY